jgi:hypothetical protein
MKATKIPPVLGAVAGQPDIASDQKNRWRIIHHGCVIE